MWKACGSIICLRSSAVRLALHPWFLLQCSEISEAVMVFLALAPLLAGWDILLFTGFSIQSLK